MKIHGISIHGSVATSEPNRPLLLIPFTLGVLGSGGGNSWHAGIMPQNIPALPDLYLIGPPALTLGLHATKSLRLRRILCPHPIAAGFTNIMKLRVQSSWLGAEREWLKRGVKRWRPHRSSTHQNCHGRADTPSLCCHSSAVLYISPWARIKGNIRLPVSLRQNGRLKNMEVVYQWSLCEPDLSFYLFSDSIFPISTNHPRCKHDFSHISNNDRSGKPLDSGRQKKDTNH